MYRYENVYVPRVARCREGQDDYDRARYLRDVGAQPDEIERAMRRGDDACRRPRRKQRTRSAF
jgi:hypothetical protein